MDLDLDGGVAGEATFDARQPLGGDAELVGDGAQREAGLDAQLAECCAARREWEWSGDGSVDLAGDVALEAAGDLAGGKALGGPTRDAGQPTRTGTLVLASGNDGPVLGPIGRYITALALSPFVPQRLRVLAAKPARRDLETLTAFIEAGQLTPVVERTYALADTANALR